MTRRVVVTGLGAVTPIGHDAEESWRSLLAGKSGVAPIDRFDTTGFSVQIGACVRDFDLSPYMSPKEARRTDPFIHYGVAAAKQAVVDAGLTIDESISERVGIAIGSGIGGLQGIEKGYSQFLQGGARKISPFFVPSNIINMIAGNLSIDLGIRGPNYGIVTACSTGTHNIGHAARMIAYGDVDVMVAGGAEMATTPTGLGGFASAKALSTRNDEPARASRPWDKERDGFVLGDGAGVMVLEELEFAKRRGAVILAEYGGMGMSGDAYHITLPPEDGDGARRCMENALRDAKVNADQVDYVNAHGTSTPAGDVIETRALKATFGAHARRLAVSSSKSMIGHLLGAAGGVEAVFCVQALRDQVAPPTINLDDPDDECDLDYVPHTAREMRLQTILSNSFGFGGTNGTLVFSRFA